MTKLLFCARIIGTATLRIKKNGTLCTYSSPFSMIRGCYERQVFGWDFPLIIQARLARWSGALLLGVVCSAALAQTTGSMDPTGDRSSSGAKPEPPPGGCTPIGVTASGEIVFPLLCKDFLERFRLSSQKAAGVDVSQKPETEKNSPVGAAGEKTDKPSETTGSVELEPAAEPAEKASLAKGPAGRLTGRRAPIDCTRFRSYDPASRTYRDFHGRQRPCPS